MSWRKINRRAFVGATAALVGTTAMPAFAFEECTPYKDENINGLLNGFGFTLGPQDREHDMIALVAPWCPNCVRLMEDARHGELPYNLFAIPTEPVNDTDRMRIAEACFAETDEEKAFFHSRGKLPKRTLTFEQIEFINRVQLETLHVIFAYARRFQSDPPKGFPTIYTAYSDGFWAGSGYVSGLYREHVKRSAKSDLKPNFINTATLAQMMETSENKKTYRLKNSQTRFRLLPRSDTLTAMCSAPPLGFESDFEITVDGKTFVGLTVSNSDLNIASTGRYVDLDDLAEV